MSHTEVFDAAAEIQKLHNRITHGLSLTLSDLGHKHAELHTKVLELVNRVAELEAGAQVDRKRIAELEEAPAAEVNVNGIAHFYLDGEELEDEELEDEELEDNDEAVHDLYVKVVEIINRTCGMVSGSLQAMNELRELFHQK